MLGGIVLLASALGIAWWWASHTAERILRQAVADADRLDPQWRLPQLLAGRAAIPDRENSALRVEEAYNRLGSLTPKTLNVSDRSLLEIQARIGQLALEEKPDDSLVSDLRERLAADREALEIARKIAVLPRGSHPLVWTLNPIMMSLPHAMQCRTVAVLLRLDAVDRSDRGDFDGAIESALAQLNVARSIGDEPILISQLVRMAIVMNVHSTVQRILAQGEPSDRSLARLQQALAAEASEPWFLTAARGERAIMDDLFTKLDDGRLTLPTVTASVAGPGTPLRFLPSTGPFIRYNHGLLLDRLNRTVEIARSPTWMQEKLWEQWDRDSRPPDRALMQLAGTLTYILTPALKAVAGSEIRDKAILNTLVVAIAAERQRRVTGQWPSSIEDLQQRFLLGPTVDPFDGRPIRIVRREDGLSVYSIGSDRQDNHGRISPENKVSASCDFGTLLFDVKARGRRAEKDLPADVFQHETHY